MTELECQLNNFKEMYTSTMNGGYILYSNDGNYVYTYDYDTKNLEIHDQLLQKTRVIYYGNYTKHMKGLNCYSVSNDNKLFAIADFNKNIFIFRINIYDENDDGFYGKINVNIKNDCLDIIFNNDNTKIYVLNREKCYIVDIIFGNIINIINLGFNIWVNYLSCDKLILVSYNNNKHRKCIFIIYDVINKVCEHINRVCDVNTCNKDDNFLYSYNHGYISGTMYYINNRKSNILKYMRYYNAHLICNWNDNYIIANNTKIYFCINDDVKYIDISTCINNYNIQNPCIDGLLYNKIIDMKLKGNNLYLKIYLNDINYRGSCCRTRYIRIDISKYEL